MTRCTVGDTYHDTQTGVYYRCTSENTWTKQATEADAVILLLICAAVLTVVMGMAKARLG